MNSLKKPSLLPLSDLHFEWDNQIFDYNLVIDKKVADIVILAGDIAGGVYALEFIKHLISLGYKVIYVLGNHEFYNKNVFQLISQWKEISKTLDNFYFLNDESVVIDGVEFFGSTLWSSLGTKSEADEIDNQVKMHLKSSKDFLSICNFNIDTMKSMFHDSWGKLQRIIDDSKSKTKVVVSHYAPSEKSIHEYYHGKKIENLMFYTELSNYIAYSNINLWIHGHVHNSFDYKIYNTRVICNPRGYLKLGMLNPDFSWTDFVVSDY